MKKPKPIESAEVQTLAACVLFAVNNFPNRPIVDTGTNKMTTWHAWFRESLEGVGIKLVEAEPKPATKKKVKKR